MASQGASRRPLLIAAVAAAAVLAGVWASWSFFYKSPQPDDGAVRDLITSNFSGLDGTPVRINTWQGKVVLVNFWATWCVPCMEEIPLLAQMQKEYGGRGLQVVGIALDSSEKVQQYVPKSPINYVVGITGMDALVLVQKLGDDAAALPYSVILDRSGKVVQRKLGAFHHDELIKVLNQAVR